jgi:hypothetical protein
LEQMIHQANPLIFPMLHFVSPLPGCLLFLAILFQLQ